MSDSTRGKRIAVTGMSVTTPVGDTPETLLASLLEGRSAVTRWRTFDTSRIYFKVGADLVDYDLDAAVEAAEASLPDDVHRRFRNLAARAPWSIRHSLLVAARAAHDAGLLESRPDPERVAGVIAGHNLNANYTFENTLQFLDEPDFVDGLMPLHSLDTDHAGSVSEMLGIRGPIYTVGGACASGNHALRQAIDEIRWHDMDVAVVVGAALDFSPVALHAMAVMGAITWQSFNDAPQKACRPFDTRREGFVPAHGCGALVLEDWERARARGAPIHAEILGVEANADANHLPNPSEEGQHRLMTRLLDSCDVAPEEVDYVNAHATSTPLGDITEVRSIRRTFGSHADRLKINATKSMLGHTCWAAAIVETVAAIAQMKAGRLHPSINIDELDPDVDLDVCRGSAQDHPVRTCMKNSFGFGGINCVSLLRNADA